MIHSILHTGLNGELANSPETSRQTLDMKVVLSTLQKRRDAPLWGSLTSEPQTQQSTASHLEQVTMNGEVFYMVQLWPSQVLVLLIFIFLVWIMWLTVGIYSGSTINITTSLPHSGLRVEVTPVATVTEGQRVTLTCITSCALADKPSYIWYQNNGPVTGSENPENQLVLDPVGPQHAGSYSCSVRNYPHLRSPEETLTVQCTMSILHHTSSVSDWLNLPSLVRPPDLLISSSWLAGQSFISTYGNGLMLFKTLRQPIRWTNKK